MKLTLAVISSLVFVDAFVRHSCLNASYLRMTVVEDTSFQLCRRSVLFKAGFGIAAVTSAISIFPDTVKAATNVPGGPRLLTGYKQLTYLLDNWEKETTSCDGSGKCERKPDNVRRYLGLRSTTDPLFQIEKVLEKAQAYIEDVDDADRFIEAAETFQSTQSMANSMAFTSSFGEYNPGGGKDQVEKYLEESRKQVVLCQKALGDIVQILKLE